MLHPVAQTRLTFTRNPFNAKRLHPDAIMSSMPTKITRLASHRVNPASSSPIHRREHREKERERERGRARGKRREKILPRGYLDSFSHGTRPSWQLLTFVRTPCRSLRVVSFGHRAARCIPMQITLAPGTRVRRNRRNFMLLRNADLALPRPPAEPLFLFIG